MNNLFDPAIQLKKANRSNSPSLSHKPIAPPGFIIYESSTYPIVDSIRRRKNKCIEDFLSAYNLKTWNVAQKEGYTIGKVTIYPSSSPVKQSKW